MKRSGLDDLVAAYQPDDAGRAAVESAYTVFRRHQAPFIVSVAAQMLPDFREDAAQGRRIVFLGRDGHAYAIATQVPDPVLFAEHGHEVVVSRVVAEMALQDPERNAGVSAPQVDGFRGVRDRVDPDDVTGSYRLMTRYLRGTGIPIGLPGGGVVLVDSSFKGTVQELLNAIYPATSFIGRYAFFSQDPTDPHPGNKHEYALHRGPDQTPFGRARTMFPDDPTLAAGLQAIRVLEDTMHGPMDTPGA